MHPPLFKPHPSCDQVVKDLVRCHEESSIAKFFGACNNEKALLDECFRIEKEERRQANLAQARDFEKRLDRYEASLEAAKKASK